MSPNTGWTCPEHPKSYISGPAVHLAKLHLLSLSIFQMCPHPSPQLTTKWFFDFPSVIIPCVSSSLRNPPGQGLIGKQDLGIPEAPLDTPAPLFQGWLGKCPARCRDEAGAPYTLAHSLRRSLLLPFFPPRAYSSSHRLTWCFLLASCSVFQSQVTVAGFKAHQRTVIEPR